MSKTVSPITLRFKIVPNYIHNIHLSVLTKSLNHLKFLQILLNFLYLFKQKTYKPFKKKFILLECTYKDFNNLYLSVVCSKFFTTNSLLKTYTRVIKIFYYINYFLKFHFYKFSYFVWINVSTIKKPNSNIFHLMHVIKNFIKEGDQFKTKIIKFLQTLLKTKTNITGTIKGVKCVCSGCLLKGGTKKKTYKYRRGDLPLSHLTSNIVAVKDSVLTHKGLIGIQLWAHI